jgi:N-acyl homoserine lactone hydrolase
VRIEPLHLVDVVVEGESWPVLAWAIRRPEGTILVDTGMIDSTAELDADWHPTIHEWPPLGNVVAVINTHLHFDHCGGNRRFAGTPTHVQRAEWEAVSEPEYVVEWARFDGATYELVDGDAELFPGIAVLFTPGHTTGHQSVVVTTDDGLVVLGGDVTYSMEELIAGGDPSIDRIHALGPAEVWLSHHREPWRPSVSASTS